MPPEPAIAIAACVAEDERATILAAAERLSRCLGDTDGGWPVRVRFAAADAPPGAGGLVLASLRADADWADAAPDMLGERWQRRLAALAAAGDATVLLLTLFRHVADAAARPRLVERIRRLNLLAVALSRAHGVQIVDVDRSFALFGARAIGTDFRGGGAPARAAAAHAIVAAMLAAGLDAAVPPERQEQAIRRNGSIATALEHAEAT